MSTYLNTFYSRNESGEGKYPQKLCDYLVERYFTRQGEVSGKRLLDVGTGRRYHLLGFYRRGLSVYGLDKRRENVQAQQTFDVRECDIENGTFPFDDEYFDFAFSKSVIEHVMNAENFLSEMLRILKPGGMAVIMTPDWCTQYRFFWDDYTHVKPYTRKGLQNAMLINGFTRVDCSRFIQLPLVWKYPWLGFLTRIVALLPDGLRWKDKEESEFRSLIRFSKEKMLLAVGYREHE